MIEAQAAIAETGHGRDGLALLRAWLTSPRGIGAQWPSGPYLARAMAAAADFERPGRVVELGPGTGPVTRALLERGLAPERLLLVENNRGFCEALRRRYRGVEVVEGDAFALPRTLHSEDRPPAIAAVVSSLPLLNWPPAVRSRLIHDWLTLLGPGGRFVQFTYGLGAPVPLQAPLRGHGSRRIWRNLWPAKVWTYATVGSGST